MENYKERLERLYRETENSLDKKKLQEADKELRELLQKKGELSLNDELKKIANALYYRNRARAFLVHYAGGFGAERYRKMKDSFETLLKNCPTELEHTVRFLERSLKALETAQSNVGKFEKIPNASMTDEDLKEMLFELNNIDLGDYGDDFGFLKSAIENYLQQKREAAQNKIDARNSKRYGEDYRRAVHKTSEFTGYDYYPVREEGDEESARCEIAATPFFEEAALYAASVAKTERAQSVTVDLKKLSGASESSREYLFQKLTESDAERMLFLNFPALAGEAKGSVICGIKGLLSSGKRLTVHDESAERGLLKLFREEGIEDVRNVFLSLPDYGEAKDEFTAQGYFSERGDETLFRKYGVYLGFFGFNEILRAGRSAWRRVLKRIASENKARFETFLERLPNRALLLDDGWRFEPSYRAPETKETRAPYSFDYDKAREFLPANLRRILEGKDPLIAKCGMVAKYCVLLGEDDSRWAELGLTEEGKAERLRRLKTATEILSELLGTEKKAPKVEIVAEEDWDLNKHGRACAYCADGGERIVFREKSFSETEALADTVLHEMYHSFQYTAVGNVFQGWWRTDLNVTPERVKEWAYNFGENRYIRNVKNMNAYTLQIIEADARIFAAESLRACGERWSELDLI